MKPRRRKSTAELPYLSTFAKAAELGSFTAAGNAVGISQAAVSQRIHTLERVLRTPLFHRRGGRVFLTEAGKKLYEFVQKILELHREAERAVSGMKTPPGGDLYLAASSIPGEHLLPEMLLEFQRLHPHIRVHASGGDSANVLRQIERGDVSLGLVGQRSDNPHLDFQRLTSDRMVLVARPSHAVAKRRHIDVRELKELPLVLREVGSGLRHGFEKALEHAGISRADLAIALELGSNEAIKAAVARGMGVGVLSMHAVDKEIKSRQLRAIDIRGLDTSRDIYLVHDRRRVLPVPARLFVAFLETHPLTSGSP